MWLVVWVVCRQHNTMNRVVKLFFHLLVVCSHVYYVLVQPVLIVLLWRCWILRPVAVWLSLTYLNIFFMIFPLSFVVYHLFKKDSKNKWTKLIIKLEMSMAYYVYGILNGVEIRGLEQLERLKNGALIVFYHGAAPVDAYYLAATIHRRHGFVPHGICEKILLKIPFFRENLTLLGFYSDRERLCNDLKRGHWCMVAPGGAYETLCSRDYKLEWRGRWGFAAVAKELGVPVVPMFTANIRQFIDIAPFGLTEVWKECYLETRQPYFFLTPMMPVKLRTYLGAPIRCGDDETAQAFARRVQTAIEALRDQHQRKPPSVVAALLERISAFV